MRARRAVALLLAACGAARAAEEPKKIEDNLFVLEEAYNQEPGVIQHIAVLETDPSAGAWAFSFTEEWPAPTDQHQVSVTVPASNPGEPGDVLLNYRFQAMGAGGTGRTAFAPRLSLVVPTGDHAAGMGRGALGVQINLPLSLDVSPQFTLHANAGGTLTPGAKSPAGATARTLDAVVGGALVWLPLTWANALVEVAHVTGQDVTGAGTVATSSELVVSPGFRFAIDFASGLQIVPGVAVPVHLSDGTSAANVLAYLSFEHPLWRP